VHRKANIQVGEFGVLHFLSWKHYLASMRSSDGSATPYYRYWNRGYYEGVVRNLGPHLDRLVSTQGIDFPSGTPQCVCSALANGAFTRSLDARGCLWVHAAVCDGNTIMSHN
jgi:hypothetical protein